MTITRVVRTGRPRQARGAEVVVREGYDPDQAAYFRLVARKLGRGRVIFLQEMRGRDGLWRADPYSLAVPLDLEMLAAAAELFGLSLRRRKNLTQEVRHDDDSDSV